MKPAPFTYVRAESLAHALDIKASTGEEAQILAGGQSLMPLLNMRLAAPAQILDINALSELETLSETDGQLVIGALVRHRTVASDRLVAAAAPLLGVAAHHVAHIGVRNRGTFGGSLSLADPASEFPACVLALGGTLQIASAKGIREVPASAFFRGLYETAIEPDEILIRIAVPAARPGQLFAFHEIARRRGDYALAGVAIVASGDGGHLDTIAAAFFGIGDRPILARSAAAVLSSSEITPQLVEDAVAALDDDLEFMGSVQASENLRRHLAAVAFRRAIADLVPPHGRMAA